MFRTVVISVALVACGNSQEERLAKIKDQVCACKTAGCAEKAMKEVPQQDIVSNHRTQTLARDMLDCLAKLYDSERPHSPDEE
jgi:hypothetical protein